MLNLGNHQVPAGSGLGSESQRGPAPPRRARSPGGSMALPHPPGPPRRAAQHRPENGRRRLGSASRPAPGAGTGRGPSAGRSARPSAPRRALQGARRAPHEAPGGRRRDPGAPDLAERTAASASAFPGENSSDPAEGHPARGLPPARRPRPDEAWARSGLPGPRPAARTVREPCACERQDSGKGKRSFNLIKFSGPGVSPALSQGRQGLDSFSAHGIKDSRTQKTQLSS